MARDTLVVEIMLNLGVAEVEVWNPIYDPHMHSWTIDAGCKTQPV